MVVTTVGLMVILVVSGCSNGGGDDGSSAETTSTTTKSGKDRPGPGAEAGSSGDAQAAGGSSTDGGDGGSSTEATGQESGGAGTPASGPGKGSSADRIDEPTTPVKVALGSGCVVAGSTQTITITSDPQVAVGYQSEYSDGRKGGSDEAYTGDPGSDTTYGGNNGGVTDEAGTWKDTWTVSAQAPKGPVEVSAFAMGFDGEIAVAKANFDVAPVGGSCS